MLKKFAESQVFVCGKDGKTRVVSNRLKGRGIGIRIKTDDETLGIKAPFRKYNHAAIVQAWHRVNPGDDSPDATTEDGNIGKMMKDQVAQTLLQVGSEDFKTKAKRIHTKKRVIFALEKIKES